MKPVQSLIKLQQMIGRGTRSHAACKMFHLLPNGRKDHFLIIDFWENEFNKPVDESAAQSTPVLVTIFNTRLKQLELDLGAQDTPDFQRTIAALRQQVAQIPTDSFLVKRALRDIEEAWSDAFWLHLNPHKMEFLKLKVGPLLRYASASDVEAATFTSKVERGKWQQRAGKETSATAESIAEDVTRLPDFVVNDAALKPLVELAATPARLVEAKPDELARVIDTLAPQMRHRRAQANTFLLLDLPDSIDLRGYILLRPGTEPVYVKEYRERVEKRINELVANHPAIQAIQRGETPDDWLLIGLERTLRQELGSGDAEVNETLIRKAYGLKVGSLLAFLRAVLGLDVLPDYDEVVQRQFEAFIQQHNYNANQINFMRAVENVFLQKRHLQRADLYDEPLSRFGDDAVDRWFTPREVEEVLAFAEKLSS